MKSSFKAKMGNTPPEHELTEDNLKSQEREVLRLSGMPDDQIKQIDVFVGEFKGEPVYMHTLLVGDEAKPPLVFMHGYAQSAALFFKIFKKLSEEFYLILIDVVGQGSSSRPQDFDARNITAEETITYFVDYLEKWRVAMNNLTNFYLSGHSIGAYIVANYAVQHPQHVKKLLLLSPIGVKIMPEGYCGRDFDKRYEGKEGAPSWMIRSLVKFAFWRRISPFDIGRLVGRSRTLTAISLELYICHPEGGFKIQKYAHARHKIQEPDRNSKVTNFMYQIFARPGTTEYNVMILFKVGFMARISLSFPDKLGNPDLPFAFSIMYGDKDWVRSTVEEDDAERLLAKSKFKESKLYLIPSSDHNMHMDNPIALANCMINDLLQDHRGEDEQLPVLSAPEMREKYPELTKEIDGKVDYEDEIGAQKILEKI